MPRRTSDNEERVPGRHWTFWQSQPKIFQEPGPLFPPCRSYRPPLNPKIPKARKVRRESDVSRKQRLVKDAKKDLDLALKYSPKDYAVLYYRGLLNFYLHNFFDAITDFDTVIEKAEDTNAKYYLARGRCYACLSMFKEAITDLSIAINLDKNCLDVCEFESNLNRRT